MWKDEIVEETKRLREEYAAKFHYDLDAIYEDLKKQEKQSQREIVWLQPKEPVSVPQVNSRDK